MSVPTVLLISGANGKVAIFPRKNVKGDIHLGEKSTNEEHTPSGRWMEPRRR